MARKLLLISKEEWNKLSINFSYKNRKEITEECYLNYIKKDESV